MTVCVCLHGRQSVYTSNLLVLKYSLVYSSPCKFDPRHQSAESFFHLSLTNTHTTVVATLQRIQSHFHPALDRTVWLCFALSVAWHPLSLSLSLSVSDSHLSVYLLCTASLLISPIYSQHLPTPGSQYAALSVGFACEDWMKGTSADMTDVVGCLWWGEHRHKGGHNHMQTVYTYTVRTDEQMNHNAQ